MPATRASLVFYPNTPQYTYDEVESDMTHKTHCKPVNVCKKIYALQILLQCDFDDHLMQKKSSMPQYHIASISMC